MSSCAMGMFTLLLGALGTSLTPAPAESPFSWTSAQDVEKHQPFTPGERLLGVAMQPSSISLITFRDERPYGDVADERAWLVRYDQVPVPAPEGKVPVEVTLYLVLRYSTRQMVAAFTEAAPVWAKSGWTSEDITKRAAVSWEFFPAESATLQSSVVDVLHAVWKQYGTKPTQTGQITIRPRQFVRKVTILDESGKPTPQGKTNGWLVEVLGTHVGISRFGVPLCTQLAVFRDGDLEFSGGLLL